jgi:hypothetical protein
VAMATRRWQSKWIVNVVQKNSTRMKNEGRPRNEPPPLTCNVLYLGHIFMWWSGHQ